MTEEQFRVRKVVKGVGGNTTHEFIILTPVSDTWSLDGNVVTYALPEEGFAQAYIYKIAGNLRRIEIIFEVWPLETGSHVVGSVIRDPVAFRRWFFASFENKAIEDQYYLDTYDYNESTNTYTKVESIPVLPEAPKFDRSADSGQVYVVTLPLVQGIFWTD